MAVRDIIYRIVGKDELRTPAEEAQASLDAISESAEVSSEQLSEVVEALEAIETQGSKTGRVIDRLGTAFQAVAAGTTAAGFIGWLKERRNFTDAIRGMAESQTPKLDRLYETVRATVQRMEEGSRAVRMSTDYIAGGFDELAAALGRVAKYSGDFLKQHLPSAARTGGKALLRFATSTTAALGGVTAAVAGVYAGYQKMHKAGQQFVQNLREQSRQANITVEDMARLEFIAPRLETDVSSLVADLDAGASMPEIMARLTWDDDTLREFNNFVDDVDEIRDVQMEIELDDARAQAAINAISVKVAKIKNPFRTWFADLKADLAEFALDQITPNVSEEDRVDAGRPKVSPIYEKDGLLWRDVTSYFRPGPRSPIQVTTNTILVGRASDRQARGIGGQPTSAASRTIVDLRAMGLTPGDIASLTAVGRELGMSLGEMLASEDAGAYVRNLANLETGSQAQINELKNIYDALKPKTRAAAQGEMALTFGTGEWQDPVDMLAEAVMRRTLEKIRKHIDDTGLEEVLRAIASDLPSPDDSQLSLSSQLIDDLGVTLKGANEELIERMLAGWAQSNGVVLEPGTVKALVEGFKAAAPVVQVDVRMDSTAIAAEVQRSINETGRRPGHPDFGYTP